MEVNPRNRSIPPHFLGFSTFTTPSIFGGGLHSWKSPHLGRPSWPTLRSPFEGAGRWTQLDHQKGDIEIESLRATTKTRGKRPEARIMDNGVTAETIIIYE